jgi:hypothetical protein
MVEMKIVNLTFLPFGLGASRTIEVEPRLCASDADKMRISFSVKILSSQRLAKRCQPITSPLTAASMVSITS